MNKSELKACVEATGSGFFDRSSMAFFGDTMANYYISSKPVMITTCLGEDVECWELRRVRPVKCGLHSSAYFCVDTYRRVLSAN